MRGIIEEGNAAHELHYLDVPDDICMRRLRERNAAGEHPFQSGEADYEIFTSYFAPPAADEGFNVVIHSDGPRTEPLELQRARDEDAKG